MIIKLVGMKFHDMINLIWLDGSRLKYREILVVDIKISYGYLLFLIILSITPIKLSLQILKDHILSVPSESPFFTVLGGNQGTVAELLLMFPFAAHQENPLIIIIKVQTEKRCMHFLTPSLMHFLTLLKPLRPPRPVYITGLCVLAWKSYNKT